MPQKREAMSADRPSHPQADAPERLCRNCGRPRARHTHRPGSEKYWCGGLNDFREFVPLGTPQTQDGDR
jgi:hypothetical protein